ncbi:hypothetical protein [Nocardioides rubriscoriae]|uniref:hypothetical protein n=1 Tax=Nocardioides rubriscoriae TaxID=642762 RepID=UPI001B884D88|nr:hypothetical protein [Nocardioides rubriscoriae]
MWVGLGGRTNQAGIDQLAAHLAPLGAQVVGVPLTKVLHLKSAVTALADGVVLGFEELVDDPDVWPEFLAVPEEPGAHVVVLDEATVLMSSSAPRTRALLEARGLRGRRRPHRVREARGVRDLPVGAAAGLSQTSPRVWMTTSPASSGPATSKALATWG